MAALEIPTSLFFTFKLNPVANPNIGSGKLDGNGIPPDFFSDKDVRLAFAYAVDYDSYLRDVLRGNGRPAHGFIPMGLLGYDPTLAPYVFDLKQAAEHMKAAWKGAAWDKGFTCTLLINDGQPNMLTLAQMVKKNIESLNPRFRLDVRVVQWSSYLEQTQAHKIPLYPGAWQADYPDPHNFAFPLLHTGGFFPSKSQYSDPRFDALVEAAVAELDPAKREREYKSLMRLAHEEALAVTIADGFRFRPQRAWVKGYVFSPVFPDTPYGSYFYDLRKEE